MLHLMRWKHGLVQMSAHSEAYRALYVHVPYCTQRCLYCDFETRAIEQGAPEMRSYTEQLCLDIMRASRARDLNSIETIYIGGGTPSFLDSGSLSQLLYTLSLVLPTNPSREWTMEANPESVTEHLIQDIWALGVNRLSLGVQSFQGSELEALGRVHDAACAVRAIEYAHTRFQNISVDLMCGIPGQTLASFEGSIAEAIALGVTHVSVYPLTIEQNTPFERMLLEGRISDVDEDFQAACMERAAEMLEAAGFFRYEVASYARAGYECKHNCAYWTGVPYLGLGHGAVSMTQDANGRVRTKDGEEQERLSCVQALAEDAMLGMRMTCGISPELVQKIAHTFPNGAATFNALVERGLAQWQDGRFVPTMQGWLCGNELYGAMLDLAP